jgi:hypothetical protein
MQVHWVEGIRSSGPEADGGFWKNGAIIGWWKYKSDQELRVFTSETYCAGVMSAFELAMTQPRAPICRGHCGSGPNIAHVCQQ